MTKLELLASVMGDGGWHSTDDLVQRVGHRFSATKHCAEKRGWKFDYLRYSRAERRREGMQFEYRLMVGMEE
jgi:hypothetical protein